MATPNRFYSSVAGLMILTNPVSALDTVINVDNVSGLPSSVPFTLVIAPGKPDEEIVTVNSLSGTTLTVVRGEDGGTGVSHAAGVQVIHGGTARDLREPQEHIAASQGVHGIAPTSSVVGTNDGQTLRFKNISGSENTLTNIPLSALPADAATTDTTQTFTNKTLTGPHMTAPVVTGGESVAGGLTADTVSTTGNATVGGNETVAGTLGVTGATTLAAVSTTGLTDSGDAAITGNETVGGTLGVTGTATVGNLVTGGSATVAGAVGVTGQTTSGTFKATGMGPATVYQVPGQDTGTASDSNATQWINCPTAMIPVLTITVPPSGRVRVTVSTNASNVNSASSNVSLAFAMGTSASGFSVGSSPSASGQAVYQDAASVVYNATGAGRTLTGPASWAVVFTSSGGRGSCVTILAGLTPGETLTLQPQFRISSGDHTTAAIRNASIVAEPML